mgnify:FL=1
MDLIIVESPSKAKTIAKYLKGKYKVDASGGHVRDLPEKYRAPVHLFYHEGYSTKQIAEILQRGEATVRSDLHRGRALLREILKEAYDFDEIR